MRSLKRRFATRLRKVEQLAMSTIYSLSYPEVFWVLIRLWLSRPYFLFWRVYQPSQWSTLHEDFLEKWRTWSCLGITQEHFKYRYIGTNGSSEIIKDLLVPSARCSRLIIFDGEYQGYESIANARGIPVVKLVRLLHLALDFEYQDGDVFFISNPSSIDGDFWEDFEAFVSGMENKHPEVRIYLDVTYVGVVKNLVRLIPDAHTNIRGVIFSLSKPFGVYYHRIGGFYSRDEMPTLMYNKYFNNRFSLYFGLSLMQKFAVNELPLRYEAAQIAVIDELKHRGLAPDDIRPANVVLFAISSPARDPSYNRVGHARWCLTPGMDQAINPDPNIFFPRTKRGEEEVL